MIHQGFVKNGVVVLEDSHGLAEGEKVQVISMDEPPEALDASPEEALLESLRPYIGSVKGLPPDFARNHDHYIHGKCKGIIANSQRLESKIPM